MAGAAGRPQSPPLGRKQQPPIASRHRLVTNTLNALWFQQPAPHEPPAVDARRLGGGRHCFSQRVSNALDVPWGWMYPGGCKLSFEKSASDAQPAQRYNASLLSPIACEPRPESLPSVSEAPGSPAAIASAMTSPQDAEAPLLEPDQDDRTLRWAQKPAARMQGTHSNWGGGGQAGGAAVRAWRAKLLIAQLVRRPCGWLAVATWRAGMSWSTRRRWLARRMPCPAATLRTWRRSPPRCCTARRG